MVMRSALSAVTIRQVPAILVTRRPPGRRTASPLVGTGRIATMEMMPS